MKEKIRISDIVNAFELGLIDRKQTESKLFDLLVVSQRRELLIDFLDDVLMCQYEGASIVDREKYVDGYLGN